MKANTIRPNLEEFQDRIFQGVIGQGNPKKELGFYLDAYLSSHIIPHLGIIAPRGQGKTKMARAIARGLYQFDEEGQSLWVPSKLKPDVMVPKRKPLLEVNCSTIKTLKQFVQGTLMQHIVDRDVTVFFDEASEIPLDVSMFLLTVLEPNETNRTTAVFGEFTLDFDFRRQSFIFATTESQKVFHALMDRLERITLQDYTRDDLADIVQLNLPDVKIGRELLMDISTVLRGNARAAYKMAEKIRGYMKGGHLFTRSDWAKLKDVLTITPLGLNAIEIQILRLLSSFPQGSSLTAMSARTGMSREQLRQDSEMYLLKHGLMEINTTGRNITAHGLQYLKELDAPAIGK